MRIMLGAGLIIVASLAAVFLLEPFVLNSASGLERDGNVDREVKLLTDAERFVPWSGNIKQRLDDALLRRTEQALQADRLDVAAQAWRDAWARARARGFAEEERVMQAGVTVYARSAQRLRDHGELELAADWNDSLFVFAVRAPDEMHREAALAAFVEGLAYRAEAGNACAAVGRIEWARNGLGGEIPGFDPAIEQDMRAACASEQTESRG